MLRQNFVYPYNKYEALQWGQGTLQHITWFFFNFHTLPSHIAPSRTMQGSWQRENSCHHTSCRSVMSKVGFVGPRPFVWMISPYHSRPEWQAILWALCALVFFSLQLFFHWKPNSLILTLGCFYHWVKKKDQPVNFKKQTVLQLWLAMAWPMIISRL